MKSAETRAIVTGGASGLGYATAKALRAKGAQVLVFDLDPAGADAAGAIDAHFTQVDVTDEGSVVQGIAYALEAMGGVSGLVNCAGIATGERTLGRDGPHRLETFRRTIDVNLIGSFNTMRLAAEAMARNDPDTDGARGVIVNTASIAAFDGQKGQAAYAASKAGIAGLTLPIARDLASIGVRVNAIAPGVFLTPMLERLEPDIRDGLAADVAFPKRLGKPEEFAAMACFIIENGYLNGEVIRLDGGLRMR